MSRIITSFDIGIKNLAYCKMEYQPNQPAGNQFKIHDWNVIDLVSDDAKAEKNCQMSFKSGAKTGQKCAQKAHFVVTNDKGQSLSVCKTHSKGYKEDQIKRLFTCKNISLFELAGLAVPELDKIDFSDSVEIIFESQPSKNPKMKNFSMMLFNYFLIRYIAERPIDQRVLKDIRFINAKNKLKVYDGPYIECKLKSQYSRNKFYSKAYCPYIIRNNPTWLAFFKGFKKKDDLADCFLQGAHTLMITHSGSSLPKTNKAPNGPIKLKKNYLNSDPEDSDEDEEGEEEDENANEDEEEDDGGEDDGEEDDGEEDNGEDEVVKTPKIPLKPKSLIVSAPTPKPVIKPPSALKPKLQLKVAGQPQLVGRQKLQQIQNSQTTKQIRFDYNINKYRQLKKGYKPKEGAIKYTLSNLKYVAKVKALTTLDQVKALAQSSSIFHRSVLIYFGSLEAFHKSL